MAKVSRLCATCVYALGHPFDSGSPGEHHLSIDAIRQAVQEGCFICSEVWRVDEQGLVIRRDNNKAVDHERHLPAKYAIDYFGADGQLIGLCISHEPRGRGLDLMPKRGLYLEFRTSV